jgi:hypothetical protein
MDSGEELSGGEAAWTTILGGRCDGSTLRLWFAMSTSTRFSELLLLCSWIAGSGAGGVTVTTGETTRSFVGGVFFVGEAAFTMGKVNLYFGDVGVGDFLSASFNQPPDSFVSPP